MTDQPDTVSDRQSRASGTFVELIDTLVDDFDVIDMMTVLASSYRAGSTSCVARRSAKKERIRSSTGRRSGRA